MDQETQFSFLGHFRFVAINAEGRKEILDSLIDGLSALDIE